MQSRRQFCFLSVLLSGAALLRCASIPDVPHLEDDVPAEFRHFGRYCHDLFGIPDVMRVVDSEHYIVEYTTPREAGEFLLTRSKVRFRRVPLDARPEDFLLGDDIDTYARITAATAKGMSRESLDCSQAHAYAIYAHENLHGYLEIPTIIEEAMCTVLSYYLAEAYATDHSLDFDFDRYRRGKAYLSTVHNESTAGLLSGAVDVCVDAAQKLNNALTGKYIAGTFDPHMFLDTGARFVNTAYFTKENPYYLLYSTIDALVARHGVPESLHIFQECPNDPFKAAKYLSEHAQTPIPLAYR